MTSREASELALAIKEAKTQREELRNTIKLLQAPGVRYTPAGQQAFAQGLSMIEQDLVRVESLIRTLRRKQVLAGVRGWPPRPRITRQR